jgi:hypothetical protein
VVKALVWTDAAGTAGPKVFVADIDRIRFTNNGMAMPFAFIPEDAGRQHDPEAAVGSQPGRAGRRGLGAAGHRSTGSSTRPDRLDRTTVPGADDHASPGGRDDRRPAARPTTGG